MALRHVGIKVDSMWSAINEYKEAGWTVKEKTEHVLVQKMVNREGDVIELIEGNYNPHVSVDWWEDFSGNRIEVVKEK